MSELRFTILSCLLCRLWAVTSAVSFGIQVLPNVGQPLRGQQATARNVTSRPVCIMVSVSQSETVTQDGLEITFGNGQFCVEM